MLLYAIIALVIMYFVLSSVMIYNLRRALSKTEKINQELVEHGRQNDRRATEALICNVAAYMHHLTAHCDKMCYNDLLYMELQRLIKLSFSAEFSAYVWLVGCGKYTPEAIDHFGEKLTISKEWLSTLRIPAILKLEMLMITHEMKNGDGSKYLKHANLLKTTLERRGRIFPQEMYPTDAEMKLSAKRWAALQLSEAVKNGVTQLEGVVCEIIEQLKEFHPDSVDWINSLTHELQQQMLAMPNRVGTKRVSPALESEDGQKQDQ